MSSTDYYISSIIWLFIVPALGGFLFGYDIGGTSFVISTLNAFDNDDNISLSLKDAPIKTGFFVSSPSAGALLGTAFLMYIDNNSDGRMKPIGRRSELRIGGIMYLIGGILEFLPAYMVNIEFINSFVVLSIGRWIYGIGIGFAMHGGPTYLAETTPSTIRGMLVGAKEIAIVIGILTGYYIGYIFCKETTAYTRSWSLVYGTTILFSGLMIIFSYMIPESARWLISQSTSNKNKNSPNDTNTTVFDEKEGRLASEVLKSLQFVWKPYHVHIEHDALMEIRRQNDNNTSNNLPQPNGLDDRCDDGITHGRAHTNVDSTGILALFTNPSYQPATLAGIGLVILQQITGQPSVLSYATPILSKVPGLSNYSSVILALFKVVATSVSVCFVETRGRKTLLFIGCSLMFIALLLLTFAFEPDDGSSTDSTQVQSPSVMDVRSYLVLFGMFAYIAGYQIGFGPITWLMISEVFPQSIRTTAVAVSVQTNFALNAFVQFVVPILETKIGLNQLFGIFGFLTLYSIYFIHQYVPETKGLTLEQIEQKFFQRSSTTTSH